MEKSKGLILILTLISIFTFFAIYSTQTVAQDLAAFYKGKTLELTVGTSPGGGYDTWGRLLAPAFGKMTGATVVVKNIPEGGGIVALDDIYHTKKRNGLKIHLARDMLPALLEATGFPGTTAKWEVEKLQWIGRFSVDSAAFGANPKKYKSFDDVRGAREFLCAVDAAFSIAGTRTCIAFEGLGLKNAKYVAGYPGGSERRLAVIRGEVDATSGSVDSLVQYFASGDLRPLWVVSKERLKELPNTPTIYELGVTKEGQKWLDWSMKMEQSGRTIVAPPDTPMDRVKFLRNAMAKAVIDPEFLNNVKKNKYSVEYLPGEELLGVLKGLVKLSSKDKEELIYILQPKYKK